MEHARELELKEEMLLLKEQERVDIEHATDEGHALADELAAEGLLDDAKEVERITAILEGIEAHRISEGEIDKAIEDAKKEIKHLHDIGHDKEAAELEVMEHNMELARDLHLKELEAEKSLHHIEQVEYTI